MFNSELLCTVWLLPVFTTGPKLKFFFLQNFSDMVFFNLVFISEIRVVNIHQSLNQVFFCYIRFWNKMNIWLFKNSVFNCWLNSYHSSLITPNPLYFLSEYNKLEHHLVTVIFLNATSNRIVFVLKEWIYFSLQFSTDMLCWWNVMFII